jgi:polyisoprenoid-binding protein YceI
MTTESNQPVTAPAPGSYTIDTSASKISFATRHMFGLGAVHGVFPIRSGSVDVADPAGDSRLRVEVEVAGVDSGNPGRDKQVRAKGLLDAGTYPLMVFAGGVGEGGTLAGNLTVRDVTKPLTLRVLEISAQPGSFTARATATVDRYAFGVTGKKGLAGRMLELTIEVHCTR